MQTQRTAAPRVPRTDLERAAMEGVMQHLRKIARIASWNGTAFRKTTARRAIQDAHEGMRAGTLAEWPPELAGVIHDAIAAKLGGRAGCERATATETRLLAGLFA